MALNAKKQAKSAEARFAANSREGTVVEWDAAKRTGTIQDSADPSRRLTFDRKAFSGTGAFTVVVGQPCRYFARAWKVVLVRLGRKPAPRVERAPIVPRGVERLAVPRRIVETFLGPLEVLDDARLDGLVLVQRENGDTMLVSRNIVEASKLTGTKRD